MYIIAILLFIFIASCITITLYARLKTISNDSKLNNFNPVNEKLEYLGKKYVSEELKKLPYKYIVLNDLLLKTNWGFTQIDHVVISRYGIFVIKTKNIKGKIHGYLNSYYWFQYPKYKFSIPNRYLNPFKQNELHKNAIETALSDLGNFKTVSIVAFCNNTNLYIKDAPDTLIKWNNLISKITSYDKECISQEDVNKITNRLTSLNIVDGEIRREHINHTECQDFET